ncbi:Gfo/Idh/MocA family oxidoreductase [Paenibacillus sp. GP183]|uniref:Gfo/Idh/MocA family protein n=1 Tax=Paenibacillus sp. GP183 TaxID=1882751 RepID=UPI000894ABAA|nr:Gfo/Idh/MocA family oxidoreductase [Paenibacillus sp. GP183]SEB40051.1 Predicted dehydrogenase [Paenibacillus sp. GP183]
MTLRIGMISYWHVHAWDYTKEAQAHTDTEITGVWDEDPIRGKAAADKQGVPFYASLNELLSSDIDGVIVNAPTRLHVDVMVAAARAGKHIFTEKVLAPTLREVNEIMAEVKKTGVKLTVSLPRLNHGYTLTILDLLAERILGDITLVRSRLSHNGAIADWLPAHFYNLEECLGGALIDLGCHPMYLTRLFLGETPTQISAQFGYITGKEVEDNAVSLLSTESGALGVVEAGFVNSYSPFNIEIHGTLGSLLFGVPEEKLLLRTKAKDGQFADKWHEIPLKPNRESAFEQWVVHIRNHSEADENINIAIELTKLMEASNRSAQEKRAIRLDELKG